MEVYFQSESHPKTSSQSSFYFSKHGMHRCNSSSPVNLAIFFALESKENPSTEKEQFIFSSSEVIFSAQDCCDRLIIAYSYEMYLGTFLGNLSQKILGKLPSNIGRCLLC